MTQETRTREIIGEGMGCPYDVYISVQNENVAYCNGEQIQQYRVGVYQRLEPEPDEGVLHVRKIDSFSVRKESFGELGSVEASRGAIAHKLAKIIFEKEPGRWIDPTTLKYHAD